MWYTYGMKYIQEVASNGLMWVNVSRQHEKELREVGKRFGFHQNDIAESLPPFQRPKIAKRDAYYFLVLHFPVYNRETKRLGFTEVDVFLHPQYLVVVHDNSLPVIEQFFNQCRQDADARATFFKGTAAHLLLEMFSRLSDAIFPSLLHINEDINVVDKQLFGEGKSRAMAEEVLRLKTNIVTFRRTMQGHKTVLDRLVILGGHDLHLVEYQSYLTSLRENSTEIWHMLESQKESITTLHETNESLLTLRTNEVMKTLTVISVLTFPFTLVATIFAIHAPGTPLLDHPWGFWILVSGTVVGALAMLIIFKRKGWL